MYNPIQYQMIIAFSRFFFLLGYTYLKKNVGVCSSDGSEPIPRPVPEPSYFRGLRPDILRGAQA